MNLPIPEGRSVLTNSATMVLMKQSSTDYDAIKSLLNLPEGQMNVLRSLGMGEGLLRIVRWAAINVTVMPFESNIIKTGVSAIS